MVDFRTDTDPPVRLAPEIESAGSIAFADRNLAPFAHPALQAGNAGGQVTHVADVAALIAALPNQQVR
jgi:hypothetical protein